MVHKRDKVDAGACEEDLHGVVIIRTISMILALCVYAPAISRHKVKLQSTGYREIALFIARTVMTFRRRT